MRSMTGFGRAEAADGNCRITAEVRGVNHRYLDLGIKLPRRLLAFEGDVRGWVKESVRRGKVDIYVSIEELEGESVKVVYHRALAQQYTQALHDMAQDFGLKEGTDVMSLARLPEVLTMDRAEEDEDALRALLKEAVSGALAGFVAAREREGDALVADLTDKLAQLESMVDAVEERAPGIVEDYRARLLAKVQEILADRAADEARILTEVTLFADRVCTDEETVRLRTHIRSMRAELAKTDEVGRKLDFIAQEMNREANTTLSKSNDIATSQIAVDMKTCIEKIREQVQNIE